MKYALLLVLLSLAVACPAFECQAFGPNVDGLNTAYFDDGPVTFGGIDDNENSIFIWEDANWIQYSYYTQGLPVTSILKKDASTLMVAQGCGTYSDGVYNFDLNTHLWVLNEWFMRPQFIRYCPANATYYLGEQEGLYKSTDAANWPRITTLGMGLCTSFACSDSHLVTNIASSVYYSNDAGQNWQQGDTPNLKGFRYTSWGALYAYMDAGSDSDGLWKSDNFGATWEVVLYSMHLSCIGPDFEGHIPLGWSQPNEQGNYLALLEPDHQLTPLIHLDLNCPVKEMDIFPLINTPSFYVINSGRFFYLTSFVTVAAYDDLIPPPQPWKVSLYPNPAKTELNLKFSAGHPGKVDVSLFDLKGRIIFSTLALSVSESELRHSLPELPGGLYLLKITDGRYSQTEKLVILPD